MPLVDTIYRVKDVFLELKKLNFESYNDRIAIKKAVNLNQATAFNDTIHVKEELLENILLHEGAMNQNLVNLETRFKLELQKNHETLEGKMREFIEKKVEEQS